MPESNIVSINGRRYDARTGLPTNQQPVPKPKPHHTPHPLVASNGVHAGTQRSSTLNRRLIKKPASQTVRQHANTGRSMDIAKSSAISRFAAPAAAKSTASSKPTNPDKLAPAHPLVTKAASRSPKIAPKPAVAAKAATPKEIKEAAISKAMSSPAVTSPRKRHWLASRRARIATIIIASLAVLVIAGYLTYVNIPSLSVSIAGAQAGINATYPSYHPDGYSLVQPITYKDGEVILNFKSNGSDDNFTISQTRSSWDSSAVLQKIVQPKVGDNYLTTEEQGLTIYSYNNSAAWVNAGLLYSIDGDAPLSSAQIRHIATSMEAN